jgi:hypothetical protein
MSLAVHIGISLGKFRMTFHSQMPGMLRPLERSLSKSGRVILKPRGEGPSTNPWRR